MPAIPWTSDLCIYCAEPFGEEELRQRTVEHIIPDALGGILTSDCACKRCNSDLGSKVDAKAKTDPMIRSAAAKVGANIPQVAQRLEEGQLYLVNTNVATLKVRLKDGEHVGRWTTLPDGSKIAPEDQAVIALSGMLRRDGLTPLQVKRALRQYKKAPYDKPLDLSPQTRVVKRAAQLAGRDYSTGDVPALAIVKMGYAFAAMLVGNAICADNPALREIRRALRDGDNNSPAFRVERLQASQADTFHGIHFEGNKPYSIIRIQLFGKAAYRVHFPNLALQVAPEVYTHDIQANEHWR